MDAALMNLKKGYKKSRSPADYGKRAVWCGGDGNFRSECHSR